MQNWEYTFPPASKEDWIRQIEKDLKGKSIESLNGEWWPGEPLIPFHHASDANDDPIVLPGSLFSTPPLITESVILDERNDQQLNKILLEALQYGTQVFLLTKNKDLDIDHEQLLKGIHLDMINLHFYESQSALPFFHSIYKLSPSTSFLRLQRSVTSSDLKSEIQNHHIESAQYHALKFEYTFISTGNWIDEATSVFQTILNDFTAWESLNSGTSFFENCILKLEADAQYFKHIIHARVLHLLWLNFRLLHSRVKTENKDYLECHIYPNTNETPEHYLIRLSLSSLAAFMSGTHAFCIHHLPANRIADFYKRIDRNLHHLLHLESGLPIGKDPLAGAFTLDYYARRWTEAIWNQVFEG